MNREIKFRYRVQDMTDGHIVTCIKTQEEVEKGLILQNAKGYRVVSREEFTGLLDKNGKEIYEGDVVERGDAPLTVRKIIEWNTQPERAAGFNIGDRNKGIAWRIIGNIYENPDLLSDTTP